MDPDGMWPDGPPSLVRRAFDYVVNTAKQAIYNAVANTVESVKEGAKSEAKRWDMSVSSNVEGKITMGPRISAGAKGLFDGDANAGSITLISAKAEADSKSGVKSDFNYLMKDDKYEISFGGGGDIAGGVYGNYSEVRDRKGNAIEKTIDGGVNIAPIQTKAEIKKSDGTFKPEANIFMGPSFTAGFIFNFSGSANLGVKIIRRNDED
ncbi:hypothetical protein [Olivibacter sp. CPCC 100613]|uniref:hypothetical protein n=1 Tax=Olivibacter sp. CPCC 100613 TaxID=3079931 RepID=UPI003FA5505B